MTRKPFRNPISAAALIIAFGLAACAAREAPPRLVSGKPVLFGLHVLLESRASAEELVREIPALAARGVNLIVAELDYNYEYVSHPELRGEDPVSKDTVKRILAECRRRRIRLVPEFQSLGHQSWAGKTFPLLVKHPEFDESPGRYPGNKDIYCRSWCPLHPGVNPVVFDLMDELIDVCEADALHVGMDEVFVIADDACPRCRGRNKAELFAKAVNDIHGHVAGTRGVEMWMWADRFIDGAATGYGEWEASTNGTYPAVDMVPRDIVLCDWHYETKYGAKRGHPSVAMFLEKGFRVLPTSFRNVRAAKAFFYETFRIDSERMLGHLCTIWRGPTAGVTANFPALKAISKRLAAGSR